MKKNGFTLVEILTVVVIIAVITTISSIGIMAVKEKINENLWESTVSLIEKSAANYGEDNLNHLKNTNTTCEVDGKTKYKCLKVSVGYLIDKNYIKTNEEDKAGNKVLIDNRKSKDEDGYYVNDTHVLIYYEDNAVYAKYMNDDVTTNPGDNENEGNGGTGSGNNGNSGEIAYMCDVGIKLSDCIKSQYTSQGVNNLYHHDGTLENGINDGSYRFAGSYESTNNWVCFGTDSIVCDDEHLYRIIGVFDGKTKLIKAYEGTEESLGMTPFTASKYSKDMAYYKGKLNEEPLYNWSMSYDNLGNILISSTLYNSILNGTYLTGIKTKWNDKIIFAEWKIGGNTLENLFYQDAKTVYENEILYSYNNSIINSKIGLMYVSDYQFAATPLNWTKSLFGYENDTVKSNNWLFIGVNEWTITTITDLPLESCELDFTGKIINGNVTNPAVIRPTFYLNSNITYKSGTGTESDPIRIN